LHLIFAKAFGAPVVFFAALNFELVLPLASSLDDFNAVPLGMIGNPVAPKRAFVNAARHNRIAVRISANPAI
jgi:hypothetical protein